jgi:rare lipoprotein A (peptidoglycan hydrolase)
MRLTCASWRHPIGSILRVEFDGKCVEVRVNDRGPARRLHRDIDLSLAAFRKLCDLDAGVIDAKAWRIR